MRKSEYESANKLNAREQSMNKSFEAQNGPEAFQRNLDRLLKMDRFESAKWPKSLLQFQNQLIKIGLNVGVEESWAPFLDLESVDSPNHVAEQVTNGLRADHFSRFEKTSFFTKRRRTVVDDPEIIDHLDDYLKDTCPLGIRSRDVRKVPGREEKERVRIVTDAWPAVFDKYNAKRVEDGLKPVSKSALRLICRNHLPHYRRANPRYRQYALCTPCSQIDALMEVVNKNSLFEEWNINNQELLRISVCKEDDYNCVWGNCRACDEDSTLAKLVAAVPNYDGIKDEEVEYAMLMSYEAKAGKTTKTTVWVNQSAPVEEFIVDLNNALFVSASKGTGKKVSSLKVCIFV